MVEILRNKNLASKFQILVEIASSGPNIQQRDIAVRLGLTPQAISDYIRQLLAEEHISSEGRSRYRATTEGVNWIIKVLRELRSYHSLVEKAITNISVCAAVADVDLLKGETVGLEMKEGLLVATKNTSKGASGIATCDARAGEDIGVSSVEGIVHLDIGKLTILKVPNIQGGGSRMIALQRLKNEISGAELVGAIGIEAIVALKRVSPGPVYTYGVTEAAIEAAKSGLRPVIICVEDDAPGVTRRLEEENLDYQLIDLKKEGEGGTA
jgi:putative transcriptional regulator